MTWDWEQDVGVNVLLERRMAEGEGPRKVFDLISFGQVSLPWFFWGWVRRFINFELTGEIFNLQKHLNKKRKIVGVEAGLVEV